MTYYERIRRLRNDRGLRQEDIADMLGISRIAYTQYELGTRDIPYNILNDLADLYNVSLDFLFGRTTIKEPYPYK